LLLQQVVARPLFNAQDALADSVVAALVEGAHTGRPGDGRVNVISVEESTNIRTREAATAPPK